MALTQDELPGLNDLEGAEDLFAEDELEDLLDRALEDDLLLLLVE